LKIILIIIAVVVGLGILGAGAAGFFVWRVAKSAQVEQNGSNAKVSLPGIGTITAGDSVASDADLGVPAYPGALRQKGGMNMSTGSSSMIMAHFATNDSIAQVTDFYKGKMGDSTVVASSGEATVLNSGGSDSDRIMVTISPGNGEDAGKTSIVIMHTKKKQT